MIDEIFENLFKPLSGKEYDQRYEDMFEVIEAFRKELSGRPDHEDIAHDVLKRYDEQYYWILWGAVYNYLFDTTKYRINKHRYPTVTDKIISAYHSWRQKRKNASENLFKPLSKKEAEKRLPKKLVNVGDRLKFARENEAVAVHLGDTVVVYKVALTPLRRENMYHIRSESTGKKSYVWDEDIASFDKIK